MFQFATVFCLSFDGLFTVTAPIPKKPPVFVQTPLRDGLKKVFENKSSCPNELRPSPNYDSTYECVKMADREDGIYYKITSSNTQNGKLHKNIIQFVVSHDGERYYIDNDKKVKSSDWILPFPGQSLRKARIPKNESLEDESDVIEIKNEGIEVIEIHGKKWVTTRWTRKMKLDGNSHFTTTWSTSGDGPGEVKAVTLYLGNTMEQTLKEYVPGK